MTTDGGSPSMAAKLMAYINGMNSTTATAMLHYDSPDDSNDGFNPTNYAPHSDFTNYFNSNNANNSSDFDFDDEYAPHDYQSAQAPKLVLPPTLHSPTPSQSNSPQPPKKPRKPLPKHIPCPYHCTDKLGNAYLFSAQFNVDQHVREKHTKSRDFRCNICGPGSRGFNRQWTLNRHYEKCHGKVVGPGKGGNNRKGPRRLTHQTLAEEVFDFNGEVSEEMPKVDLRIAEAVGCADCGAVLESKDGALRHLHAAHGLPASVNCGCGACATGSHGGDVGLMQQPEQQPDAFGLRGDEWLLQEPMQQPMQQPNVFDFSAGMQSPDSMTLDDGDGNSITRRLTTPSNTNPDAFSAESSTTTGEISREQEADLRAFVRGSTTDLREETNAVPMSAQPDSALDTAPGLAFGDLEGLDDLFTAPMVDGTDGWLAGESLMEGFELDDLESEMFGV